jgi:predicted MFS family arabinose efflux permease
MDIGLVQDLFLSTLCTPPVLYLFALCNLVIGSDAFVIGGILLPISQSLKVSLAAVGQAMTAYAIATALLAPLLIIRTARRPRKRAMFSAAASALGSLAFDRTPPRP